MNRKWILIALAAPFVITAVLAGIGWTLPKEHTATCSATLSKDPQTIWNLIIDIEAAPKWRDVESVETLEPVDGRPRWRENGSYGPLTIETVESRAPELWITRVVDDDLPFAGTWTYRIEKTSDGCRLSITEEGEIRNPVFRTLARYAMGYHRSLEIYFLNLGEHLGEKVSVTKS